MFFHLYLLRPIFCFFTTFKDGLISKFVHGSPQSVQPGMQSSFKAL